MYFKQFPNIYYPFNINGVDTLKIVKDITLNVRVMRSVLENVLLYDEYYIQDGDTPEIIAEKMYGDPNLNWTIMLVNDKFDYVNDFPLSNASLEQMVSEKYGFGNRDVQHILFGRLHYTNAAGTVIDNNGDPGLIYVSNYDYEARLNESKRSIKLISNDVIGTFVSDIQQVLGTNV